MEEFHEWGGDTNHSSTTYEKMRRWENAPIPSHDAGYGLLGIRTMGRKYLCFIIYPLVI